MCSGAGCDVVGAGGTVTDPDRSLGSRGVLRIRWCNVLATFRHERARQREAGQPRSSARKPKNPRFENLSSKLLFGTSSLPTTLLPLFRALGYETPLQLSSGPSTEPDKLGSDLNPDPLPPCTGQGAVSARAPPRTGHHARHRHLGSEKHSPPLQRTYYLFPRDLCRVECPNRLWDVVRSSPSQ